ncbi:hypothetical protein Taro_039911 [Colocasia esculenta]|uniref:Transcription initiation factor TFIID subunit 13 n=1 Tax=Colocasia esculenta TaxID=4460 RepID=A0A843WH52_COLES|nr:hypothetical protein [Colocasia esculenta]
MQNSSSGPTPKPKAGSSQPSEVSLKRKRGVFQKDLQHMMYGFGDDPNPLPETVALVEDIVVEYVTDLAHKAQDIASKRGKLLTEDFLFLMRKIVMELDTIYQAVFGRNTCSGGLKGFPLLATHVTASAACPVGLFFSRSRLRLLNFRGSRGKEALVVSGKCDFVLTEVFFLLRGLQLPAHSLVHLWVDGKQGGRPGLSLSRISSERKPRGWDLCRGSSSERISGWFRPPADLLSIREEGTHPLERPSCVAGNPRNLQVNPPRRRSYEEVVRAASSMEQGAVS